MTCAAESLPFPPRSPLLRATCLPDHGVALVVLLARSRWSVPLLAAALYSPRVIRIEIAAQRFMPGADLSTEDNEHAVKRACVVLGAQAAAWRNQRKIKQAHLADDINFSRANLSDSETGRRLGSRDLWRALDAYLGAGGLLLRRRDLIVAMQTAVRDQAVGRGGKMPGGPLMTGAVGGGAADAVIAARDTCCPYCGGRFGVPVEVRVGDAVYRPRLVSLRTTPPPVQVSDRTPGCLTSASAGGRDSQAASRHPRQHPAGPG